LQEREFERVGGNKTIRVDVRLIAATNRDLTKSVAEGKFRQDLYYRLNVFPVHLPPLRERPEDIALLAHYFISRYAAKIGRQISRVPREVMQRLSAYAWPGNIRELENVIERAVILSPGPDLVLEPGGLPVASASAPVQADTRPGVSDSPTNSLTLEQAERTHIISVLKQTQWRIDGPQGAARILSVHPNTLRSRLKKLGLRRGDVETS
jgi:transcriptional regulator with GAF, ATPase, and Fis domain